MDEKELENLANGWLKKFNDMESGYLTCIEKLEEGIEKYLDNPEFDTGILTKLINKEKL